MEVKRPRLTLVVEAVEPGQEAFPARAAKPKFLCAFRQRPQRVKVEIDLLIVDGRSAEPRNPEFAIVEVAGMDDALASRRVDDKHGSVEARSRAANLLLQFLGLVQWQAEMLRTPNHVAKVDVVGMHLDPAKAPYKVDQGLGSVVHATKKDGLIADHNPSLAEPPCRAFDNGRDLSRVIEVGVQADMLEKLPAALENLEKRTNPFLVAEEFHRLNRQSFRRKSQASDMVDVQESMS